MYEPTVYKKLPHSSKMLFFLSAYVVIEEVAEWF